MVQREAPILHFGPGWHPDQRAGQGASMAGHLAGIKEHGYEEA